VEAVWDAAAVAVGCCPADAVAAEGGAEGEVAAAAAAAAAVAEATAAATCLRVAGVG